MAPELELEAHAEMRRAKTHTRANRRLIALALIVLLAAGITTAAAVVIPGRLERQRQRRAAAIRRTHCLLSRYASLLERHPGVDLSSFEQFRTRFEERSMRERIAGIGELEEMLDRLQEETLRSTVGAAEDAPSAAGAYETFTPVGFKRLFAGHAYRNTTPVSSPPAVTGSPEVDGRIRGIAERRGYRLTSEAREDDLVQVEGRLLQPEAARAWSRLREAAGGEGIRLGLISGYRSIDYQRRIFLNLLRIEARERIGREWGAAELASGGADAVIDAILTESSIPGYSRHHTGYTLDITDLSSGRDFTEFGETAGFRWISAHNYLQAKRFGFIPSYPEGAGKQGPEPEPWEYVWIGETALRRPPPCD